MQIVRGWKKRKKRPRGLWRKGGAALGEFQACLETARLIAMRFRFETGSRQHLENESLQLTKKLCGFLLLRFMYLLFYSFLCSLQRGGGKSLPSLSPFTFTNSPSSPDHFYTLHDQPRKRAEKKKNKKNGELFLDLSLLKVRGTLMLQKEKVP